MPENDHNTKLSGSPMNWQNHIGLIVGTGASTLIALKLLAVAGWDLNTAFGILSTSGTANVLTGALLALLPTLYALLALLVFPEFERRLSQRTDVERAAARLFAVWPVILLLYISPIYLLIAVMILGLILTLISVIRRHRKRSEQSSSIESPPSRFERTSVLMSCVAMVSFASLSTPWLPPETIVTEEGEEAAYLVDTSDGQVTVLLAQDRELKRIDASHLTGDYCQMSTHWAQSTVRQAIRGSTYARCPS